MPVTEFLTICVEGPTVDGRNVTAAQIDQMAKSYDPKTYGARLNVEHQKSIFPDSIFGAYGDVIALRAVTNDKGKRALQAKVDATDELVKLNKKRQKVYWSAEVHPNFAQTGEAYLMALAVTDYPASLGTEMLKLAIQSGKMPEQSKDLLFSESVESPITFSSDDASGPTLLSKVKDMLAGKAKGDDARIEDLKQAVTVVAEQIGTMKSDFATAGAVKTLSDQVTKMNTDLAGLVTKLNLTPETPERPQSSGGGASNQTDC